MHAIESASGNQVVDQPRFAAGEHFVYREARWVDNLLRGVLVLFGFGLVALAGLAAARSPTLFSALCLLGAGTLIYGATCLRRTDDSTLLVATPAGLYFPECRLFGRRPGTWLFVPWRNVLDYRAQLMLDETSRQGLVLSLRADRDENLRFFAGLGVFSPLAHASARAPCDVLIGYSTFLPGPHAVVARLREFELSGRAGTEHAHDIGGAAVC